MFKAKYKYNPKTLSYEKVKLTTKGMVTRLLSYMITGGLFGVLVILLAYNFFESPKERAQRREIEQFKLQYKILDDRIAQMAAVMEDMQDRDDNIYRVILEAEPIPNSVRKAGYGGVDRYAKLDGYRNSSTMIETTKKLDHLTSQIYVQSKSFDELFDLAKNKEEMMLHIPAIQPINKNKGQIISGFGMRFHPILKFRRMHTGIDISAPRGTPIYATADGEVNFTGRQGSYGNTVIIDHGYGYQTLFGHMYEFTVKRKDKVKRGQIIGYVGSTGLSQAPHVHYEVIKDGIKINPVNFFYNDFTPEEFERILELASRDNQVLS
ncbi:MAG: peptidase M23 [Bacteroidetes bacterium HGW-Bacteroidetes-17]|jgi:murein DD-endopeptidase MepM/ murein hydrolase activator NlpD|nr:MAG: peptidase M23 [Bacteroidetes bacterium HGW-Bacteroidetes-17]